MRIKYKIRNCKNNVKYALQRGKNGYDEVSMWNIDTWFLITLTSMLDNLIPNLQSYPSDITEDEWKSYLLKMNNHFKQTLELLETGEDNRRLQQEFDLGIKMFKERFFDLWD